MAWDSEKGIASGIQDVVVIGAGMRLDLSSTFQEQDLLPLFHDPPDSGLIPTRFRRLWPRRGPHLLSGPSRLPPFDT